MQNEVPPKKRNLWRDATNKIIAAPYHLVLQGGYAPSYYLDDVQKAKQAPEAVRLLDGEPSNNLDGMMDGARRSRRKKKSLERIETKVLVAGFQEEGGYADARVYKQFVFKVFGIVLLMHLFMLACNLVVMHEDRTKEFIGTVGWVGWVAWLLPPLLLLLGLCMARFLRIFPNYVIFLPLFTLSITLFTLHITVHSGSKIIVCALITIPLILIVTIIVCSFGVEIVNKVAILLGIVISIVVGILLHKLWGKQLANDTIGVLLGIIFAIYYLYDLTEITKDHNRKIMATEWGFAATALYLDMMNTALVFFQVLDMLTR